MNNNDNNNDNKLCNTQFSHHPMTDSQPVLKQWSRSPEIADFMKLLKKTKLPEKFELPDKRQFELMEMRKKDSCPAANPQLYTECDVYGMEYFQWPA